MCGVEPRCSDLAVMVDVTEMCAVLVVDNISRAVRIQAGVLSPVVEDQLRPHYLTLRHLPDLSPFFSFGFG
ncbi:hypothetical protein ABFA25_10210 [Mycobacterium lepromatosis]|nr:hypothetical protein [Mycobacterium lepromatosis]